MNTKEIYLDRLKKMQATVRKIKPAPKTITAKISLSNSSASMPKTERHLHF